VLGALAAQLDREVGDLQFEVVDQPQADVDVAAPRIGDLQAIEQLAAGVAEQIRHRARVAEGDQRRVDAVLERRAMADEMQAEPRELAFAANRRVGQPDRRHQIAPGQLGQHARVDLVGLAGQRRQAFDLLRVGNQHLPAEFLQRVVHEPRAVHRLDHRPHSPGLHAHGEMAQTVGVRRGGGLRDQLAGIVEQADVEPTSTEIQSSVQHEGGPPRARSSMTR
jgi:hypothetical protein